MNTDQNGKAKEIMLFSFSRPHMRAFHCSWWGFFIAFFIWFAIAPLLPEIRKDLKLTKQELWTSSIIGVGGTILVRFILGPLCDKYGSRKLFTLILCTASIPTAMTGLVHSASDLYILRGCIGIVGGTFVMCQHWTVCMFADEIVGTANGIVAGWGNLGGGVTQLIMGSVLFPLFTTLCGSTEQAWRTVSIVPAVVAFSTGLAIYFFSDDCPKGNYGDLKKRGVMKDVSLAKSAMTGSLNWATWIMFIQYACCFGVELTMQNAAVVYFVDQFGQSTESAAAIASIFGWMNLFARGMGGFLSDVSNSYFGMRGRIWAHTICLLMEGAFVLFFSSTTSLGMAIGVMIVFSTFVQAAEGTSFGIVPYISRANVGTVTGIVGAGGNVGAVGFGLAFRQLGYEKAFLIMGITIIGSALLSPFIFIQDCSSMFSGKDDIYGDNDYDAGPSNAMELAANSSNRDEVP